VMGGPRIQSLLLVVLVSLAHGIAANDKMTLSQALSATSADSPLLLSSLASLRTMLRLTTTSGASTTTADSPGMTAINDLTIVDIAWFSVMCGCVLAVVVGAVTVVMKGDGASYHGASWEALVGLICVALFAAVVSAQYVINFVGIKFLLANVLNLLFFVNRLSNEKAVDFNPSQSDLQTRLYQVNGNQPENLCWFAWPINGLLQMNVGNDTISVGHVTTDTTARRMDVHYVSEGPMEQWSPIARYNARRAPSEATIANPSSCCFDPSNCAGVLPSMSQCPGYWLHRDGHESPCMCLRAMLRMGLVPEDTMTSACFADAKQSLFAFLGDNTGFSSK